MQNLKRFIVEEEAMGTIEVVLIAAVLIGLGIMFKDAAVKFVNGQTAEMDSHQIKIDTVK